MLRLSKNTHIKYKSFTNNFTIAIDNVLFWVKINNGLLIGDVSANSIKDLGKLISVLKEKYPGEIDMKKTAEFAKKILSK